MGWCEGDTNDFSRSGSYRERGLTLHTEDGWDDGNGAVVAARPEKNKQTKKNDSGLHAAS